MTPSLLCRVYRSLGLVLSTMGWILLSIVAPVVASNGVATELAITAIGCGAALLVAMADGLLRQRHWIRPFAPWIARNKYASLLLEAFLLSPLVMVIAGLVIQQIYGDLLFEQLMLPHTALWVLPVFATLVVCFGLGRLREAA